MKDQRFKHWWERSPEFRLAGGYLEPQPGMEDWFEWFWQPMEALAWTYEAVRRLPFTRAKICETSLETIKELPRFDQLSVFQEDCLWLFFNDAEKVRPPIVLAGGYATEFGYSSPRLMFDIERCSKSQILKALFADQGSRGRNRNQRRNREWWRVAELEHEPNGPEEEKRRTKTIAAAKAGLPAICRAWKAAHQLKAPPDSFLGFCPYIPGVSGEFISVGLFFGSLAKRLKSRSTAS